MNRFTIQIISKILTYLLIIFAVLTLTAYFKTDRLPPPKEITAELAKEPLQTKREDKTPFFQEYSNKKYRIDPQYDYELYGLVVSTIDLQDAWFNIYYARDPYNIKDVCVIWGSNLEKDYYQKVSFESQDWMCFYRYSNKYVPYFNGEELSNNHLLPATTKIAGKLKQIHVGDQIHIKGFLANYNIDGEDGIRKSSITRVDTGKGACEVVYVEELEILKPANSGWHTAQSIFLGLCILSLVLKAYVIFLF